MNIVSSNCNFVEWYEWDYELEFDLIGQWNVAADVSTVSTSSTSHSSQFSVAINKYNTSVLDTAKYHKRATRTVFRKIYHFDGVNHKRQNVIALILFHYSLAFSKRCMRLFSPKPATITSHENVNSVKMLNAINEYLCRWFRP